MNLHVQFVYYVPENSNVQRPTGAKLSCQVASVKYEFVELLDRLNLFNVWHIFSSPYCGVLLGYVCV